jgi:protease-4
MSTAAPVPPSNPIASLFRGLWGLIRFTNHMVLFGLLVFLFMLVLIGVMAGGSGSGIRLQDQTVLVIDLDGTLVEQHTLDPVQRAIAEMSGDESEREIQLRDLLRALEAARTDERIERVVLRLDGFGVSGFAALREVAAAVRELRAAGKEVVAYGAMVDQKAYYLAAHADRVVLDPMGGVLIEGLGRYRLYFREALQDKLGLDVQLFRVGEYKSAAEPFVLDAASPEAQEADLFWMNDLWQRYLAEVATAREVPLEDLRALVEQMPARVQAASGDLARLALDAKLVDALQTPAEFEDWLVEQGAAEDDGHVRAIAMEDYLQHLGRPVPGPGSDQQVAVVVAQGEIVDGEQPQGMVGGESTAELVRRAREDENVRALVLRVDSPGGGVYPSEQIRREVAMTREAGKPVIVSMGNVAASGGYWISMNADRIYADESTITGSIGIYGLWLSGPRLLESMGVRSDGVTTAPLAGAFDPSRPLDPNAAALIQSVIEHGYAEFIGKVSTARGASAEQIDQVGRGRVWSGAQARERGLVDELGGLRAAIAEAARRAELQPDGYQVTYVERELTPFQQFVAGLNARARHDASAAWLNGFLGLSQGILGENGQAQARESLLWAARSQSRPGQPVQAVAHCLCGL